MSNRNIPYIGISGVVNETQQHRIVEVVGNNLRGKDTIIALGVKATHKTQWLDVPNKYGELWYPVGAESFHLALGESCDTHNTAQVYLEPQSIAADPEYASAFVKRIQERGRRWLDTIQFDMLPYHDNPETFVDLIDEARADGSEVIVQCHQAAMAEGPRTAVEKLKRLSRGVISYVLFDASHGRGKEMDPDALKPFLEAAYHDADFESAGTNFGIAGGLDADAVLRHLPAIYRDFNEVSWDAEGKLHQTADGSLDMERTLAYLRASLEVIV